MGKHFYISWKSVANPPKQNRQEIESELLKVAKFDGNKLLNIDEARYNFPQGRFIYEDDKYSTDQFGTKFTSTHWMTDDEYWTLLENLDKIDMKDVLNNLSKFEEKK